METEASLRNRIAALELALQEAQKLVEIATQHPTEYAAVASARTFLNTSLMLLGLDPYDGMRAR